MKVKRRSRNEAGEGIKRKLRNVGKKVQLKVQKVRERTKERKTKKQGEEDGKKCMNRR